MPCGANPLFLSHCVGEAGEGGEPVELPPVPVPVIEYRYEDAPYHYSVAAETPYVLLIPGGYAKAADLQGPPVEDGQSWEAPLPLTGDTVVIGVTADGRWSEPAVMPEAELNNAFDETITFVAEEWGGELQIGFGTGKSFFEPFGESDVSEESLVQGIATNALGDYLLLYSPHKLDEVKLVSDIPGFEIVDNVTRYETRDNETVLNVIPGKYSYRIARGITTLLEPGETYTVRLQGVLAP
jgi:hypothetical protein